MNIFQTLKINDSFQIRKIQEQSIHTIFIFSIALFKCKTFFTMQDVVDILKCVFRFPAVSFWLTCIITPTCIISSSLLSFFVFRDGRFLPISSLITSSSTKYLVRFGLIFGLISLVIDQRTCHLFYSRLKKKNQNNIKINNVLRIFLMFLDAVMILIDLSLLGIIVFDFSKHQIIHIICTILFFVSSIAFHFGIDDVSFRQKKSIPVSLSFNIMILIFSILSGILFAFSKSYSSVLSIAALLENISFVLIFFKYIFVAMTVLGGSFLPKRIFSLKDKPYYVSMNQDNYLP